MKKLIYIVFISLLLLSCKKNTFVQPDYIIFGAIQSNCLNNNCRFVYYLDNSVLNEDTTVKYYSTKDITLFKKELGKSKFLLAKDLINKVPTDLIKTNKNIFIDINASSTDLWYAEIKINGRKYNWTFDNAVSSTPSYLKPFAEEMLKTINLIRN